MKKSKVNLIVVPETTSTNSLIREMDPPHATAVHAIRQTAGRGQRGNSWESEPGANVTLSLILRPISLAADSQFIISQAVALGAADLVAELLEEAGSEEKVSVKWPNDIYVGDKKIAGILIENSIGGRNVTSSIIGIGLNVNQTRFVSDAPNPVSLANLTGLTYETEEMALKLAERMVNYYDAMVAGKTEEIDSRYRTLLYRRSGLHRWRDALSDREFQASIHGIDSYGRLLLLEENTNEPLAFSFKEIVYL